MATNITEMLLGFFVMIVMGISKEIYAIPNDVALPSIVVVFTGAFMAIHGMIKLCSCEEE